MLLFSHEPLENCSGGIPDVHSSQYRQPTALAAASCGAMFFTTPSYSRTTRVIISLIVLIVLIVCIYDMSSLRRAKQDRSNIENTPGMHNIVYTYGQYASSMCMSYVVCILHIHTHTIHIYSTSEHLWFERASLKGGERRWVGGCVAHDHSHTSAPRSRIGRVPVGSRSAFSPHKRALLVVVTDPLTNQVAMYLDQEIVLNGARYYKY